MIKGILFDLNGTLIEMGDGQFNSDKLVLGKIGITLDRTMFEKYFAGRSDLEGFSDILRDEKKTGDPKLLSEAKKKEYLKVIMRDLMGTKIIGLPKLAKEFYGLKTAVVSGVTKSEVMQVLEELKIENYIDGIIGCEEVSNGKPDPEPYLKAAEKIGLKAEECIVIDDNPKGIKSGNAAGAITIGFVSGYSQEQLKEAKYLIENEAQARKMLFMLMGGDTKGME
jgi:beta-phosphoglucomutase